MKDGVRRFLLRGAPVRGEIVSLDEAWREVVARHALPVAVRDRLGELSAAALLLAATLKFDGALVVQIHGDGPVALFVVESRTDGSYRATAKLRDETEDVPADIPADATLASLVNAGGAGRFAVTLDARTGTPGGQAWQGIVPIEGDSVAQMLERYMRRSEQLPTRLWLAADGQRAVGLLLQRLPDEGGRRRPIPGAEIDADGWNRLQQLADTIGPDELLGLPPETVLQRLFWQEPLHAFDDRPLRFACSCSREKVVGMLRMLGRPEVESVLAEREAVEVRCDFCNELWRLDPVDCAVVFTESPELAPASSTRH